MTHFYGEAPAPILELDLSEEWQEFMHYLYLPVRIPGRDFGHPGLVKWALPERLGFLEPAIHAAWLDARSVASHLGESYIYVTARRGYATPGNPLNRPGWHCDDFGGTDLNYTWTDAYPTRILRSDQPLAIPPDDQTSMEAMSWIAAQAQFESRSSVADSVGRQIENANVHIEDVPLNTLMRMTPHVIHDTPIIPEPGGMRSFFKISISDKRYDLVGNSHNHLLSYDWPLVSRVEMRNRPQGGNKDYSA